MFVKGLKKEGVRQNRIGEVPTRRNRLASKIKVWAEIPHLVPFSSPLCCCEAASCEEGLTSFFLLCEDLRHWFSSGNPRMLPICTTIRCSIVRLSLLLFGPLQRIMVTWGLFICLKVMIGGACFEVRRSSCQVILRLFGGPELSCGTKEAKRWTAWEGGGEVIEWFQGLPGAWQAVGREPISPHSRPPTHNQPLFECLGKCEGGALFLHLRIVGTFTTGVFNKPLFRLFLLPFVSWLWLAPYKIFA